MHFISLFPLISLARCSPSSLSPSPSLLFPTHSHAPPSCWPPSVAPSLRRSLSPSLPLPRLSLCYHPMFFYLSLARLSPFSFSPSLLLASLSAFSSSILTRLSRSPLSFSRSLLLNPTGYHPSFTFDRALETAGTLQPQLDAKAVVDTMAEITGFVRVEMTRARLIQQEYPNRKRSTRCNLGTCASCRIRSYSDRVCIIGAAVAPAPLPLYSFDKLYPAGSLPFRFRNGTQSTHLNNGCHIFSLMKL